MATAEHSVASTLELGASHALVATGHDGLRQRHLAAAHRAEAVRAAERARWSQHSADASWYAGKLRAARQFDAHAARDRELAARLIAEADALVRA